MTKLTSKDIEISKLPKTWITIKGASDKTIENICEYFQNRDNAPPALFSNMDIEMWVFDKLKGKYVRFSKDKPLKKGFWKELRNILLNGK